MLSALKTAAKFVMTTEFAHCGAAVIDMVTVDHWLFAGVAIEMTLKVVGTPNAA